jgi:hypothetical protein
MAISKVTVSDNDTINTVEVADTNAITVVTVGTQGPEGPNTILGASVANAYPVGSTDDGAGLIYDHANTRWLASTNSLANSLNFKIPNLTFNSGQTVSSILDEDNMGSDSNTALATQQSIKAYVNSQISGVDLDFQGDSGGALSIVLGSETLTVAGGTGIDTVGSGNSLTVAIDSTVATLTGTQTLTNKTLTAPILNTVDINGGDIDSATTINKSPTITLAGDLSGNVTLTNLGDATLTATVINNSVALGTDTTGNYVAEISAGEGIDVSGSGSETATVTISAEDATSSNKGIASFDATDFSVSSGAVTIQTERIQDIVGAMVSSNTESGIAVTYDDTNGKLDFNADDFVISLAGDLGGSVTITNLASATLTATIQANSVALGTDTTGNYLATLAASNSGIDVANSGSESAAVTVGLNTEYVQDLVGGMVSSNTESGIAVTYDDTNGKLDFNVSDPVITLSGDVAGSGTLTNLGDLTITTTIQANSVALGTDTTGNYIATATAGEGIDISGSGSESAAITISAEDATDSNKGIASFDSTDFTVSSGAVTVNAERVQDIVGAMVTSNTESGITVEYQDSDGTLDFTIGTLNQDTTGNAATATALETARTIGGVSFDGTANIDLAGVNTTGNQDTTGNSATTTALATARTIHGVSFDGTANIDLTEVVQDTVGGMFSSNTETGITATYQDSDGTIDLVVGTLNQDTTGNAATATALETARTIDLSGDVTASGVSFDGTGNITLSTTIAANSVALGTDTTGNYVATIAGTSNEIEVSGSGSESATVTIGLPSDVTIGNDLTVTGDLTVNGTTTTVATTNMVVSDNLIELNNGASSNANDSGIVIERGSTGDNAIIMWDESADKFTVGTTTATGASTGNLTVTTGTLVANIEGNVTGNVTGNLTGNVTGNVTGDVTGNADTATTLATARTIGGTSFDGSANIAVALATAATTLETARTIHGVSFDGSANIDLTEVVQDTVGAMFSSNTETNITATYQDGDGTIDLVVDSSSATETLTNKTITNPTISDPEFSGTLSTAPSENTTQTLTVTVASKTSEHPYDGGSSNAYVIDGVESPYLTLTPDTTYRFDQSDSSNSGHPLAFYYESDKTTSYSTGVTTNGTAGSAGAYTEIKATASTPTVLFYQCTAHALMGNRVNFDTRNLTGFDTDDLSEGSTNQYFTNARSRGSISVGSEGSASGNGAIAYNSTSGVLTYTPPVLSGLTGDTDDVSEGSTNLYHTTERVQDVVGGQFVTNGSHTGLSAAYDDAGDGAIDLSISSGGVTNAMLAGSIANDKLANSSITVTDGTNSTATALGGTITFTAGEGVDITESSGTITIAGEDATSSNKGIASFTGDFSVSSGAVSLANSGVTANSYGSATAIPVITVDAKGRLTAVSTASISTSFTLSDGSNTQSIAGGDTLTVSGTSNEVDVAVSATDTLTIGLPNDVTISNNLTVSGNLVVTGTTTQTGSVVTDNNFTGLTNANTGNATDFGFYGKYVESSTTKYAGLFYDASTDNTFRLFVDSQTVPSTTVNTSATGYAAGDLVIGGLTTTGITIGSTAVTSTAAELNILDGVTSSTAELNILDGVTSTTAELNILDGVTSTTAELNILDGVTSTTAELNILDGVTATASEINIIDGDTSATSTTLADADRVVVNDNGTMKQVALTDFETYFESALDTLSNVTTVGTLGTLAVTGDVTINTNVLKVDTSNNRIGIKNASPDVTLDIGSATDAIHVPVGTTAQRPSSPAAGYFRYNTTTGKFEGYTNAWGAIAGSGSGGTSTLSVNTFTGDDSTTAFTLSQAPASEDNLIVFIEGVYQNPNDFVLNGTTLTLDSAPLAGRKIVVYHVSAAVSGNNLNHDQFTANGSTAAFTLSIAPIHENNTQVFIDGVYQQKDSYAVSGTTLTLDANPANGAKVEVMTFTQTDVNTLPASFVSGLTEVTAASTDHMMIFDATDNSLKKALVSDVIETVGSNPTFTTAAITNTSTGDSLTITTTEDSSTAAPVISLKRNSGSPADADYLGQLKFKGENDADQEVVYAKVTGKIDDASDGTEDGLLEFANIKAGSQTITARLKSDKFQLLNGTALDVTGTYTGPIGYFEQEGTGGGNHGLEVRCASTSAWAFLTKVNGTAKLGQTGDVTYVGGQLGIGTTSPSASHAIDIHNTAPIINIKDTNGSGSAATGYIQWQDSGANNKAYIGLGSGSTNTLHITNYVDEGRIDLLTNGETQFVVTNKDNVDSEDIAVLQGTATGGSDVIDAIRMTKMGYGASYQCTQFGVAGGGRNISLMYDPSSNTDGGFGGNGECVVGNGFKMISAYNTNAGFFGVLATNSSNQVLIGGNYSVQGHITIDTDGEIRLFDQQSVQSNYTGLGQCQGVYSDTISAFACSRNSSGASLYVSKQNTGTSDMIAFHVNGNDVGEITTNGSNSTTFSGTSDYRLKENVEPLPNATQRLNALNPVAFNWIRDGQEDEGFLAHEVQAQVPYAATGSKDEVYTEENTPPEMEDRIGQPKYQKVDYGRITPLLVKALQESNAKIEALEARIETLENA